MSDTQASRLAVAFARETARSESARLCAACVEVLEVTGAGITIMGGDRAGPICVSDDNVAALEDVQFSTGRGPCQDAFASGVPVHAPRLGADVASLWPPFVSLAKQSGFGAVFAYPLITADSKVGVLTLYQQAEGDLTVLQRDDSLALADVLTETVVGLQHQASPRLVPGLDEAVRYRAEIYQASGMTAVQLGVSADEALLRIRAFSSANGRTIAETASRIVARRLRLPRDDVPKTEV